VPKLWEDTIDAHRRSVRDAAIDAVAALLVEDGPGSLTMATVARRTGLGRATLYRYFPDIGSLLAALHDRQVAAQLEQLSALRDQGVDPAERLEAVLEAYALMTFDRSTVEVPVEARAVDGDPVGDLVRELLVESAATGSVREDVSPEELARFCVHALAAARDLPSTSAVSRLVTVTMTGLLPPG
jgi:AcrR family transcriptional regulator